MQLTSSSRPNQGMIQIYMMFWTFVCKHLSTKKLIPVLGILCLVVVIFDIIMLTKQKQYSLSRSYRNIETTSHIFTDIDKLQKRAEIPETVNWTKSQHFTESVVENTKNVSAKPSISNIFSILSKSFEIYKNVSSVFVKTKTSLDDSVPTQKSVDYRPDNCTNCFLHNFSVTLNNEHICKIYPGNATQNITILILIFTSHARREQRDAIRETWLTYSKNNTSSVRYAFLLGATDNIELNHAVLEENKRYGDLLQENFTDSYLNLTLKTMMGFKWASNHCAHAQFVLKTDDDMYVNIPFLVNITRANAASLQSAVGGNCFLGNQRPMRDKHSKWYASNASYPNEFYPGFCSGTGYLTSISVIKNIYEISKNVPFFHLEDIYVSLCLKHLGYQLLPLHGFHNHRVRIDYCKYKSAFVVTSHEVSPSLLRTIWTGKCRPYNFGMRVMGFVVALTFFIILCLCSMVQ